MAKTERVYDSLRGWVRSHIRTYVHSHGQKGHRWHGLPSLLLTTRGRRSGKRRRTALIYGRDGRSFLLVASNGGSARHPAWYLNLSADGDVTLQVGGEIFTGRARTATKRQRPRLWRLMCDAYPPYQDYQVRAGRAGREIPLVIVDPT
jgi:deazaflavin-dependent oxidoreductase (nitroreductase family)